jgi:hypothetical protein
MSAPKQLKTAVTHLGVIAHRRIKDQSPLLVRSITLSFNSKLKIQNSKLFSRPSPNPSTHKTEHVFAASIEHGGPKQLIIPILLLIQN